MSEDKKALMLLEFISGGAAGDVQRGASPRLFRWAEAFDQWMAERGEKYTPSVTKQAKQAWRRLLRERQKNAPGANPRGRTRGRPGQVWEMTQEDIEQHVEWMKAEGYAASTIYNALGIIANF
jgi:hypothetical protein